MNTSHIDINKENDNTKVSIINLGLALKKGKGSWTIFCPSLKVLGYSNNSEKDALKDFKENLIAFFDVHLNDNSLERALLKFKWEKDGSKSLFAPILRSSKPKFAINNESALKPKNFELAIAA